MNINGEDDHPDTGDADTGNTIAPSSEKSPTVRMRPVPPVHENISANGCKTPGCENFGVAPMEWPVGRIGRGGANPSPDAYRIINVGQSVLACDKCGKSSTVEFH